MLVMLVRRSTEIRQVSVSPACEMEHPAGVRPPAVARKRTEIGEFDVCLGCAMQLGKLNTICAYDATDNPLVILEGEL